jgi:RNA polymerase sigma-70 factor (ECF subfamily)
LTDTAFDQLVSEYLQMRADLVRFLTARLGQAGIAEDVYQEMFIRLRLGQLPADVGNPRAFLYKMAFNLANDAHRAGQRRAVRDGAWLDTATQKMGTETIADAPSADDAIDAKRRLDLMLTSLAELPAKCREAFTLHRLRGLSHREVAAQMGITTKTVEKHMTTALKQLATKLGHQPTHSSKEETQGGGEHGA